MREQTTHGAALRTLIERFGPQIDAAYRRRVRRQCSRDDFAEGYVNGLVDTMAIGTIHDDTTREKEG